MTTYNFDNFDKFVKLTNSTCCHNGFKYAKGKNVDVNPFSKSRKSSSSAGLYFCRLKHIAKWLNYGCGEMIYLWDVNIPDDECVIDMGDVLKAHTIILSNKRPILSDHVAVSIITKSIAHMNYPFTLSQKYMKTEDLVDTIHKTPILLEHVENQTLEICLAAVKKLGLMLEYVKEQTPEICLAAVKENGYALKYVKDQTTELCLAAIQQNGDALRYVKEHKLKCE